MKARIISAALLFLLFAGGAQAKHKDLAVRGAAKTAAAGAKAMKGTIKAGYKIFRFVI